MLDKPTLRLKLELDVPDSAGGPPQKYSVARTLKARWVSDLQKVSLDILSEIKDYKGSFLGDTVMALGSIVTTKGKPIDEDSKRSVQVAKWAAGVLESLVFASVSEGAHQDLVEDFELPVWDGTFETILPVTRQELREVDVEKVMTLLAPKIKHALTMVSKDVKE
jgi:hypothetical protein